MIKISYKILIIFSLYWCFYLDKISKHVCFYLLSKANSRFQKTCEKGWVYWNINYFNWCRTRRGDHLAYSLKLICLFIAICNIFCGQLSTWILLKKTQGLLWSTCIIFEISLLFSCFKVGIKREAGGGIGEGAGLAPLISEGNGKKYRKM